MQREDARRHRFILPKPMFKHVHNIRFLTTQTNGKQQGLGYNEKASPDSLGQKVASFKRDLLRFQMKNHAQEKMSDVEACEKNAMLKGDDVVYRNDASLKNVIMPSQHSDDVHKTRDRALGESKEQTNFIFTKPNVHPRPHLNKVNLSRPSLATTTKTGMKVDETRHELNPIQATSDSGRDPREDSTTSEVLLSSRLLNTRPSGKILFSTSKTPDQRSSVLWKNREISKQGFDSPLPNNLDGIRFFDQGSRTSEDVNRTSNVRKEVKVIVIPRSSSMNGDSGTLKRAGESVSLKSPPPYRLGIDARKRQLEHTQLHLMSSERQSANCTSEIRRDRNYVVTEVSPRYQYSREANSFEPMRKLPRVLAPSSESQMRIVVDRGGAVGVVANRAYEQNDIRKSASSPSDDRSDIRTCVEESENGFSSRSSIGTSSRPTAIIRADRRELRSDSEAILYKERPMGDDNPSGNACDCVECRVADSNRNDVFKGSYEKSVSPSSRKSNELGYTNGDISSRYEPGQIDVKRGRVTEEADMALKRSSFDQYPNSEPYGGRNRSKILFFPKNENSREGTYYLDRGKLSNEITNRNDRIQLSYETNKPPLLSPEELTNGRSAFWDAVYPDRKHRNSIKGYPELTYDQKAMESLRHSSLNTPPHCGSPNSEKIQSPPRLIGSNARAMESFRTRNFDKLQMEMGASDAVYNAQPSRPNIKKTSQVVVTYSYPRHQKLIERGEGRPCYESVSYRIHERVMYIEEEDRNPVKLELQTPNWKESIMTEAGRSALSNSAETDVKVSF